jgi:hypothetical protein
MDAQNILVEVTVSEGATSTDPYGSFVLNFKGVVDAALLGGPSGTEVETMRGTLYTVNNSSNLPQFEFINLGGDSLSNQGMNFGFEEAANVLLDDTSGTSGQAVTNTTNIHEENGSPVTQTETYAVSFDQSNLLRGKDTDGNDTLDAQECLSRTTFNTHVWRYNLYHESTGTFNDNSVTEGSRVELNSGFPFNYDSNSDGTDDAFGWVGYHGVWTENGTLSDGTTINKFDYTTDTTTEMTVNVSPGKMIRRTASTELLSSFQGDEFQYWGPHPTLNIHGQWVVTVDGNNDFALTASMTFGQNGPQQSSTVDHDDNPATAEVNVAASISLSDGQWLWLWSDSLGGNINYAHDASVAASARQVTFYNEEIITPADSALSGGSLTLNCYVDCLIGGLTQTNVDAASDRSDLFYSYSGTAFQYVLSAANGKLTLTDQTSGEVVTAASLDLSNLGHEWGINTGEMITGTISNANEPWQVFEETVSYRWETGQNDWNKLVTVTNSSNVVQTFDRPLRFTYTHSTANDANNDSTYDGKKFMLEYGGPGDLWGFPWVEDSATHHWYAAVTLKDGTQLTDGTNNFVVKAIEKEQSMESVSLSACSALDVTGLLSNTSMQLPTSSDIGTVSHSLSSKPTVTDAPAVIEGEVQ